MKYIKSVLIDAYLDYLNDYLTHEKYASDNSLELSDADEILRLGKKYWVEHCDFIEFMKEAKDNEN